MIIIKVGGGSEVDASIALQRTIFPFPLSVIAGRSERKQRKPLGALLPANGSRTRRLCTLVMHSFPFLNGLGSNVLDLNAGDELILNNLIK